MCDTYMYHAHMWNVHMNEACHISINAACHTYMNKAYFTYDLLQCVTHACDILIGVWNMPHSYICHMPHSYICGMPHSYVWHALFSYIWHASFIYICGMPHSCGTICAASVCHVAVCCSVLTFIWAPCVQFKLECVGVCCSALQCVAACCSVLQCVAVFCCVLQCELQCVSVCQHSCDTGRAVRAYRVAVCWSMLQCVAVCCSVLQCVAVCCRALQCVAVRCAVLQCVEICMPLRVQRVIFVLDCGGVRCSASGYVDIHVSPCRRACSSACRCACSKRFSCCSVLLYILVCCSVLQCAAVW